MNKFLKTSGLTAAVLVSGLIGCNGSKEVSKDVYQAPPLKVQVGSKALDFKIWELETNRKLDITDSFDFSASGAANVSFDGKCTFGDISVNHKIQLSNPMRIEIISLIPKDYLGQDLQKANLRCSYKVTLTNSVGSNYIFDVASYEIGDSTDSKVTIETETSSSKKSTDLINLHYSDTRAMFRFRNSSTAMSELSCADITLDPQPFNHFIDLIRFDQKSSLLRPGRDSEVLVKSNFLQSCRLLIIENGLVVATSPLFNLRVPGAAFSVNKIASEFEGKFLEDTGTTFTGWQTRFTISSYEVRNDWKEPRIAVIPVRSFSVRTYSYIREARHREGGWANIEVDLKGISTFTKSDTEWRVIMRPGSSLTVSLIFDTPETPFCIANNEKYLGIGIFPFEVTPTIVSEFMISEQPVRDWNLEFGKPLVVTTREYPEWGVSEVRRMPEVPCGR